MIEPGRERAAKRTGSALRLLHFLHQDLRLQSSVDGLLVRFSHLGCSEIHRLGLGLSLSLSLSLVPGPGPQMSVAGLKV